MKKIDFSKPQTISILATRDNFDETAYLRANKDVAAAVKLGDPVSGRHHFLKYGINEGRHMLYDVDPRRKKKKLEIIKKIIRDGMEFTLNQNYFDFLTPELRTQFNIIETNTVSSNEYDDDALKLIKKHKQGIILDCGAGSRSKYYQNVVNFEIAAYPSTDVLGVGEVLPFKDNSFDAVFSLAVLEHVKDPFLCASEILRVLKPGGDLMCCVPFLQPVHGYPHHYYNMTGLGLVNLFQNKIKINKHEVPPSTSPIWSLSWILNSWADGLDKKTRRDFVKMRVGDLMKHPSCYTSKNFVTGLSKEKKHGDCISHCSSCHQNLTILKNPHKPPVDRLALHCATF